MGFHEVLTEVGRAMARDEEPKEVRIARDVLRRMLRGRSQGQISIEIGKARNYVNRLLTGVIPFSMSAAIETLYAAGVAPADYFRLVAEECSCTEEEGAVWEPVESFEATPSLRRIERRLEEINERVIGLASRLGKE